LAHGRDFCEAAETVCQSRLFMWLARITPVTAEPGGRATSNGESLVSFMTGHASARLVIRYSRIANNGIAVKPQDVYVVLKLVAAGLRRAPYSHLALELVMSPSEVHASVKRARASGLVHGTALDNRPNLAALEEFLVHGLKYAFPPEHGEMTRGVATSYGAAPMRQMIAPTDEPIPVWLADALREGA
jgi:hypothetical protein